MRPRSPAIVLPNIRKTSSAGSGMPTSICWSSKVTTVRSRETPRLEEQTMPKGYWIPHIDVSDPEGYKAYMAATPPAHEKYHGVALVRAGRMEVVEGHQRSRN